MVGEASTTRYCRKCGFDLRAHEGGVCPECGRAFSLVDPKSFRRRPLRRHRWVKRVALLFLFLVLSLGGVWGWARHGRLAEEEAIGRLTTKFPRLQCKTASILPPWVADHMPPVLGNEFKRAREFTLVFSPRHGSTLGSSDVEEIRRLVHLRTLDLRWDAAHKDVALDLTPLTELETLTMLSVSPDSNTYLPASIVSLQAWGARLPIEALMPLRNLQELTCTQFPVADKDLDKLPQLAHLMELDVGDPLSDFQVEAVSKLPSLKILHCGTPIGFDPDRIKKRLPGVKVEFYPNGE